MFDLGKRIVTRDGRNAKQRAQTYRATERTVSHNAVKGHVHFRRDGPRLSLPGVEMHEEAVGATRKSVPDIENGGK